MSIAIHYFDKTDRAELQTVWSCSVPRVDDTVVVQGMHYRVSNVVFLVVANSDQQKAHVYLTEFDMLAVPLKEVSNSDAPVS